MLPQRPELGVLAQITEHRQLKTPPVGWIKATQGLDEFGCLAAA